MSIDAAREELRSTAAILGRLAAEAATKGAYDETIVLARWAAVIADLVQPSSMAEERLSAPSNIAAGRALDARQVRTRRSPRQGRAAGRRIRGRGANHSSYPRFERRGNDLIKIGWSKRERREYEQKAPKDVIDRVVKELVRRAGSRSLISTEELIPAIRPVEGPEIPTYQVYVVLAWLRTRGIVEAVGRQGYRVLAKDVTHEIEPIWGAL